MIVLQKSEDGFKIASLTLENLQKIWNSPKINLAVKKKVLKTCVFSTFLYATEIWTLKKVDINKITAFALRCYRRLLNVKWFDYIRNEAIFQRTNPDNRLLQQVKKRKLSLFSLYAE